MVVLSVVVPALNEEGILPAALTSLLAALDGQVQDYEVIVVDDGSTDRTGEVAEEAARKNPRIRVVHNPVNRGLGHSFRQGVELATGEYVGLIPGDDEITQESLREIIRHTGKASIVIMYHLSSHLRQKRRRILSDLFTKTVNLAFGLDLEYYNGPNIFRRELLKSVSMTTDSFAYMAEILVQCLKKGVDYTEAGFHLKPRAAGESKAMKLSNMVKVAKAMVRVWCRIYLGGPFRRPPVKQTDR